MKRLALRSCSIAPLARVVFVISFAVALGGVLGAAYGQSAETVDQACAADCTARGYEGEYCGRVCDLSDVSRAPRSPPIDLRCTEICRERGGSLSDCLQSCPMR